MNIMIEEILRRLLEKLNNLLSKLETKILFFILDKHGIQEEIILLLYSRMFLIDNLILKRELENPLFIKVLLIFMKMY